MPNAVFSLSHTGNAYPTVNGPDFRITPFLLDWKVWSVSGHSDIKDSQQISSLAWIMGYCFLIFGIESYKIFTYLHKRLKSHRLIQHHQHHSRLRIHMEHHHDQHVLVLYAIWIYRRVAPELYNGIECLKKRIIEIKNLAW